MYLKLSGNKYIDHSRIVGIFDMDTATVCVNTRKFLSKAQKEGRVYPADEDIPKSFLLIDKKKEKQKKYIRKDRKKKKSLFCDEIILCKLSSGVLYGRLCASFGDIGAEEE